MEKERGFTIVELMVGLSIAAILLTVGLPSMHDLIRNNRLVAATNTFVSSLYLVRSEAIKQGRNATLCVSSDLVKCTGEINWQLGWIAWVDIDASGGDPDAGEILRIVQSLPASITITPNVAQSSFQIDAQGAVNNPNVTLDLCDDRTGEIGKQLRIMATGGVSLNSQFACI